MKVLSGQAANELAKRSSPEMKAGRHAAGGRGVTASAQSNRAIPRVSFEESVHPQYGRRGFRSSKKCAGGGRKEGKKGCAVASQRAAAAATATCLCRPRSRWRLGVECGAGTGPSNRRW